MADKAKKQVVKLHKAFLDEIDACDTVERQGLNGLSSLANMAQRLPHVLDEKAAKFGILSMMKESQTLLTRRHFESLEESRVYVARTVEYFGDHVENMQRLMNTCVDVFDSIRVTEQELILVEMMEWMENVMSIAARKKELCRYLGYSDVAVLNQKQSQWMSKGAFGAVNREYVSMVTIAAKAKAEEAAKRRELPEDEDE